MTDAADPRPLEPVAERVAHVPSGRLGDALRSLRRGADMTISNAAGATDVAQIWLFDVEQGRLRADPEYVQELLTLYGASLDEVIPPRRALLPLIGADADEVLANYLAMVQRWRPGQYRVTFRDHDIDCLARVFDTSPDAVVRRLRRIERSGVPTGVRTKMAWRRLRHAI